MPNGNTRPPFARLAEMAMAADDTAKDLAEEWKRVAALAMPHDAEALSTVTDRLYGACQTLSATGMDIDLTLKTHDDDSGDTR